MLSLKIPFLATVLVKVDYNLSSLSETYRIESTKKTILELLLEGNKVVLITHYGRPTGQEKKYSTKNLQKVVESKLGQKLKFINQFESFDKAAKIIANSKSKLFLLENTRFSDYEEKGTTEEKYNLGKEYSKLGQFYVDEAFSVSHRKEVTNTILKNFIPFGYGYRYQLELKNLDKLQKPKKPYYLVMGGAKVETKLPLIEHLLPKADKIFIGGMICFTFLEVIRRLGNKIPPLFDTPFEEEFVPMVTKLLQKYPKKIVLPIDLVYKSIEGKVVAADIGSLSTELFCDELKNAKTIFWNGTLGEVEKPTFDYSTKQLVKTLLTIPSAFIVCGGGDTESFLSEKDKAKLDFVSTGGGACLDYLSKN
jgi:phosphoglycerate kinase